jgi:hypothetical protein
MNIRCGRCQTAFAVPGPGQYPCPACGAVNEVAPALDTPGSPPAPAPVPEPSPYRSAVCPECGFEFRVGEVATAPCPNCRAPVDTEEQ